MLDLQNRQRGFNSWRSVPPGRRDELIAFIWRAMLDASRTDGSIAHGVGEYIRGIHRLDFVSTPDGMLTALRSQAPHDKYSDKFISIEVAIVNPAADVAFGTLAVRLHNKVGQDDGRTLSQPAFWEQAIEAGLLGDENPDRSLISFAKLRAAASPSLSAHTLVSPIDPEEAILREVDYWRDLAAEREHGLRRQAALIHQLRLAADGKSSTALRSSSAGIEPLTDLRDIASWVTQLGDGIVITPAALQATRKSDYSEPSTLGKALELLAGPYRAMRRGEIAQKDFDSLLAVHGLEHARSARPSTLSSDGPFRIYWDGRSEPLSSKIAKGNSRSPVYCLRVYFFYCERSGRVIVGHCPTHLPNWMS